MIIIKLIRCAYIYLSYFTEKSPRMGKQVNTTVSPSVSMFVCDWFIHKCPQTLFHTYFKETVSDIVTFAIGIL